MLMLLSEVEVEWVPRNTRTLSLGGYKKKGKKSARAVERGIELCARAAGKFQAAQRSTTLRWRQ